MQDNDFLSIGRIVGVHGLGGNLKVYSYAESLAVYKSNTRIYLDTKDRQRHQYIIEAVKPHKQGILLSLKGVATRDLAQTLVGAELFVEKESLPELENGEYYWFDIIGLAVYTLDHAYLGRVEAVIPTDGNDVFVVRNDEREILIPALASVVFEMNIPEKIMHVRLPEGL